MFHLVPYKRIRRTQYIPELGLNYNMWGFYLEVFLEGIKWSHYETFFSHNSSRVVQYTFTRDIVTIWFYITYPHYWWFNTKSWWVSYHLDLCLNLFVDYLFVIIGLFVNWPTLISPFIWTFLTKSPHLVRLKVPI